MNNEILTKMGTHVCKTSYTSLYAHIQNKTTRHPDIGKFINGRYQQCLLFVIYLDNPCH